MAFFASVPVLSLRGGDLQQAAYSSPAVNSPGLFEDRNITVAWGPGAALFIGDVSGDRQRRDLCRRNRMNDPAPEGAWKPDLALSTEIRVIHHPFNSVTNLSISSFET